MSRSEFEGVTSSADPTAHPPVANIDDVATIEAAGWPAGLPATTYALLRQSAARFGEATALSFFLDAAQHERLHHWSYRALFGEVTRAANLFTALGVGLTEVVAYLLPNLPETHFVLWGAETAGVALAINPLLAPDAIRDILRSAGARVLVTLAPFPGSDLYANALAATSDVDGLTDIVLIDMTRYVPGWKRFAARLLGARTARRTSRPTAIAFHGYAKLRRQARPDRLLREGEPRSTDISSYFCTGGTTGTPKIAVRIHANEVANGWMSSRMGGSATKAGDTIFCGLPLFHVNAVMVTGLAAFLRGAHVLIGTPQGYRGPGLIARFWEIVEHHKLTSFSGVPTLYASLLQQPAAGHDLSSLHYVYCGAAPMPADLIRAFEEKAGVAVLEGYGLTEGTCVSSVNPIGGERRPGSIGIRLPFQMFQPVILDDDGAYVRDAAVDEVGAIAISGPNLFRGYLSEANNAGVWIERGDGRRWFNTGDLGRIDADGYVWLVGRTKDIIIRGGHNIDPGMIEDALYRHPAVELVAAIGRPDAYAGELPVAYVQLHAGQAIREEALLAFANEHVGERATRPKAVYILDALPLTAVGKIFKPALREIETRRTVEEALTTAGVAGTISIQRDPQRGLIVRVTTAAQNADAVRAALAGYAFTMEIATAE